jgi:hypothetical protein
MKKKMYTPLEALAFWISEIHKEEAKQSEARMRIGEALKAIRGKRTSKEDQRLWTYDPDLVQQPLISTFNAYCKWKFQYSEAIVNRYIKAWLLVEDLTEDGPTGPTPDNERVARPITKIKGKDKRAMAWEMANEAAKKEGLTKPTSKHTSEAASKVRQFEESTKNAEKKYVDSKIAKIDLDQIEKYGLIIPEAKRIIKADWKKLAEGRGEKEVRTLARVYVTWLTHLFPEILDEPEI